MVLTRERVDALKKMLADAAMPATNSSMTGRIVLVEPNKLVTDPSSGTSYCTRETWDALRAATRLKDV